MENFPAGKLTAPVSLITSDALYKKRHIDLVSVDYVLLLPRPSGLGSLLVLGLNPK